MDQEDGEVAGRDHAPRDEEGRRTQQLDQRIAPVDHHRAPPAVAPLNQPGQDGDVLHRGQLTVTAGAAGSQRREDGLILEGEPVDADVQEGTDEEADQRPEHPEEPGFDRGEGEERGLEEQHDRSDRCARPGRPRGGQGLRQRRRTRSRKGGSQGPGNGWTASSILSRTRPPARSPTAPIGSSYRMA